MIYLKILIGFLKVGLFSFGGAYGAIPLIRDVVLSYGWLTDEELTNMIAISESTPGPIMVNIATYVGSSQAGLSGALIATAAVVTPAFFIIIILMYLLNQALKNKYVQSVLGGLRPCITGIILATGIYLILGKVIQIRGELNIQWRSLIVAIIIFAAMYGYKWISKKQMSPFSIIILSAICGVLIF